MARFLIIDDQTTTLRFLSQIVKQINKPERHEIATFQEPETALKWLHGNTPDLVLIDYKLPKLDGIETVNQIRSMHQCAAVPVVMVTAYDDRTTRHKAFDAGVTDFITKPIDHYECRARCTNLLNLRRYQLELESRNTNLQNEVSSSLEMLIARERETLFRLARAGEYRDQETGNHVLRMAKYSRIIAEYLGLNKEQCELIERAAPMHDLGKIGVSDSILLKKGRLTDDEFEAMKLHTVIGYEILKDSPSKYLQTGATIALSHHEHYDGSGYPEGRRGDSIPIEARIVAVADVFDALTSLRPYKGPWPVNEAMSFIYQHRGTRFDPWCVAAVLENTDAFLDVHQSFQDDEETEKQYRGNIHH